MEGYLQKVSRKTGRSRWRNPKRGRKLVRLTVREGGGGDRGYG